MGYSGRPLIKEPTGVQCSTHLNPSAPSLLQYSIYICRVPSARVVICKENITAVRSGRDRRSGAVINNASKVVIEDKTFLLECFEVALGSCALAQGVTKQREGQGVLSPVI